MATLTTKRREDLRSNQFAYIDRDGGEHLPIHDAAHVRNAIARFDALASTVGEWGAEENGFISRWIEDIRYASLGFTRWEAQSPRYRAHRVIVDGRALELALDLALDHP